jgi:hypothetical protein
MYLGVGTELSDGYIGDDDCLLPILVLNPRPSAARPSGTTAGARGLQSPPVVPTVSTRLVCGECMPKPPNVGLQRSRMKDLVRAGPMSRRCQITPELQDEIQLLSSLCKAI